MALKDDLDAEVRQIFRSQWTKRDGNVVPDDDSLKLTNDSVSITATVLYADLTDSTKLVDSYKWHFAAEIYKAYLHCAGKIIRSEGGVITAYDGDRVMAVYIDGVKNTAAVRTAMKINYAVLHIINPAIKVQYPNTDYAVHQVIGVDTSDLFVAKTGLRGANDLVWVGRAANYAAKLSSLSEGFSTWITDSVYNAMKDEVKVSSGKNMWEQRTWSAMNNMTIYRSNWWWTIL